MFPLFNLACKRKQTAFVTINNYLYTNYLSSKSPLVKRYVITEFTRFDQNTNKSIYITWIYVYSSCYIII